MDILINNKIPGIEFGHGDVGFKIQATEDHSKFGIFLYDSERTKTGDFPNIKENSEPYFALTFTNLESLDIIIGALNKLKECVQSDWKE